MQLFTFITFSNKDLEGQRCLLLDIMSLFSFSDFDLMMCCPTSKDIATHPKTPLCCFDQI